MSAAQRSMARSAKTTVAPAAQAGQHVGAALEHVAQRQDREDHVGRGDGDRLRRRQRAVDDVAVRQHRAARLPVLGHGVDDRGQAARLDARAPPPPSAPPPRACAPPPRRARPACARSPLPPASGSIPTIGTSGSAPVPRRSRWSRWSFSTITRRGARCRSCAAMRAGGSLGWIGQVTAPSARAARSATTHSGRDRLRITTRSPSDSPRPRSPSETRPDLLPQLGEGPARPAVAASSRSPVPAASGAPRAPASARRCAAPARAGSAAARRAARAAARRWPPPSSRARLSGGLGRGTQRSRSDGRGRPGPRVTTAQRRSVPASETSRISPNFAHIPIPIPTTSAATSTTTGWCRT